MEFEVSHFVAITKMSTCKSCRHVQYVLDSAFRLYQFISTSVNYKAVVNPEEFNRSPCSHDAQVEDVIANHDGIQLLVEEYAGLSQIMQDDDNQDAAVTNE